MHLPLGVAPGREALQGGALSQVSCWRERESDTQVRLQEDERSVSEETERLPF